MSENVRLEIASKMLKKRMPIALISEITSLSEERLVELKEGIKPSKTRGNGKVIEFDIDDIHYRLTRLMDDEYVEYHRNSMPIEDNSFFEFMLITHLEEKGELLKFSEVYVALQQLCGRSSKIYDDWKSSFSFPFLFEIHKEENVFPYLLTIRNFRSSLEFKFRRILDPDDKQYDRDVIHEPFEDEFSAEDIHKFLTFFHGYLEGYFSVIKKHYDTFFFKRVDSNLILFGYKNNEFFEEQYEDQETYHAAIEELEKYEAELKKS